MAQQQQNITVSAPGFQGLNTEDSPLQQDPGFAVVADNAVVDKFGRIGSRKPWTEFTTAVNVTYSAAVGVADTQIKTHRLGNGDINGVTYVLATVGVYQYNASGSLLQDDYFICKLTTSSGPVYELDEISYPTLINDSALADAKIVSFNDKLYIFSAGNECLEYDGSTIVKLFTGTNDVDYIKPQDDTGTIAATINGDVAAAAYGRLWVSGVNGDYQTIYYSDLLIATQWYDGRAVPADAQNTGGILNINEYWPRGTDRIVGIVAHNNALFIMGRQSILVYNNAASGDPAGTDGIVLADTISGIGCVNRDAIANIGSDVLFVDDSGVRSIGRTIQEKSAPLNDLTSNVRRDITDIIALTADKTTISLSYWPDENLTVVNFSNDLQAFAIEMRAPSVTGGNKVTRWTNTVWERAMYYEIDGEARVLLASSASGYGCLLYEDGLNYNNQPFEFKYESNSFTFGQPANSKFVKQIDFTVVSTLSNAQAYAGWGYSGRLDYTKALTITAQAPALYNIAYYNQTDEYGPGLTTIKRYRVNAKGSGESVIIGFRIEVNGNTCSLQEINVQTLIGRII